MTVDCVEMAVSEACGGFLNGFASKTVRVNYVIFSLKTSAQKKVLKRRSYSPGKEIWKRNGVIFRAGVMLIQGFMLSVPVLSRSSCC